MKEDMECLLGNTMQGVPDSVFTTSLHRTCLTVRQADSLIYVPTLPQNSMDCVLTDPPYFLDGFTHKWSEKKLHKRIDPQGVIRSMPKGMKFDPKQGLALQQFMRTLSDALHWVLKPGAFYLCFAASRLSHRVAVAIEDSGFEIRDIMLWQRPSQPKAMALNHLIDIDKHLTTTPQQQDQLKAELRHYKTPQPQLTYEAIILAQKPKTGTFVQNFKRWGTGLMYAPHGARSNAFITEPAASALPHTISSIKKSDHMTPKPVQLIEQLLHAFSRPAHWVLDPFMGSGSTALACLSQKRHCLGVEINATHFELTKKRVQTYVDECSDLPKYK